MKIVIVGAGAIGSLFGALLAKNNTVVLVGRAPHITAIQHNGLNINGKTHLHVKLSAVESVKDISISPNLILLTVKSYDTETAIKQTLPLIRDETVVVSLQNGLDNIEKIEHIVDKDRIFAGVTTHGAIFSNPGVIRHTGKGKTILGELDGTRSKRLENIVRLFNEAGIETQVSDDVVKEIWAKAIINSSINPLTAFFNCKNGYLLENPLLKKIVETISEESTNIAQAEGIKLTAPDMIQRTKEVIEDTASNYSSMLQSVQQRKKTEIDSINGKLVTIGKQHRIDTPLNKILVELVTSLTDE
ncbi:MAG: 2-dehydropantoate 2-reductase [Thermoplasmata archaeon]|nr:2-dehydropantoate 2-reductase [Thermoplasmata archaeon]